MQSKQPPDINIKGSRWLLCCRLEDLGKRGVDSQWPLDAEPISYPEGESDTYPVVSDSLWPHGLSSGQNTVVGSLCFSRGSSQPRDQTQVSHIAGGFFTSWTTRETCFLPKETL